MITSVSGSTIGLRLRQGTGSVDFTPSTKVVESSPAQLSDVTPGSCIAVLPDPGSAPGSITAKSVIVSSAIEGKCPPPVIPSGAAPAAPSGSPAANSGVQGKVDTVSGNAISIIPEANGNTRTNVSVTDTTSYTKQAATDTEALTSGRCMSADGAKNDGGVIQAVTIDLQPCPPMGGRPHHRFPSIPHIPLPHHHR